MAGTVASVKLIDREGESDVDRRSATDTYRVVFAVGDVPNFNDVRLAVDPGTGLAMPRRGNLYDPTDSALKCKSVRPRIERPPDPRVWLSTVVFSTGDVGDEQENPLLESPKVRWGTQVLSEPIYKDRFGAPIANSSKETFDPPVEKDFYDSIVVITRNSSFYDETVAVQYRGKVNLTSFNIRGASQPIQAFKAKIADWTGDEATKNGIDYWVETLTIVMRADGWNKNLLDQGFSKLNTNGTRTHFTDTTGIPLNQPTLLNGTGDKLVAPAPPVFLVKEICEQINFNNLNLPTN